MVSLDSRPLPGGPLALDLLNTAWTTGDGPVDWLVADAAVKAFAAEHGHPIADSAIPAARAALVSSRNLVRRLLEHATAEGHGPASYLIGEVNDVLGSARVAFVQTADGPAVKVTGAQDHNALAVEALVNAVDLSREHASRVRSCDHADCVLWFLDTSKGGRRRWCSMEQCGNRAKARRHYERMTQRSAAVR